MPDAVLALRPGATHPWPTPAESPRRVDVELDLQRLAELQDLLGKDLPEIVATLLAELRRALHDIDFALSRDDLPAAALAAHAARNSALMIDARPVLERLGELEAGARREDPAAALAANERLREAWPSLRRRLERAAAGAG
jgi:hypothetical protein